MNLRNVIKCCCVPILAIGLIGCNNTSKLQPSASYSTNKTTGEQDFRHSGKPTVYIQGVPYYRDENKIGNTDLYPGFYVLDWIVSKDYKFNTVTLYSLRNYQLYYGICNGSMSFNLIEAKDNQGNLRYYDSSYDRDSDLGTLE